MGFFIARGRFPDWLNGLAHCCCGVCIGVTVRAVLHHGVAVPDAVPFFTDTESGVVVGTTILYGAGVLVYSAIRVLRMVW
jgi:hypothetical protein